MSILRSAHQVIDEMAIMRHGDQPAIGLISKIEFALNGFYTGLGAGFIGIAPRCSGHSYCSD